MGFERWANLPPNHTELQTFGHAAVSEDGTLEIKLIGIDGDVKFEKTMSPEEAGEAGGKEGGSETSASATVGITLASIAVVMLLSLHL